MKKNLFLIVCLAALGCSTKAQTYCTTGLLTSGCGSFPAYITNTSFATINRTSQCDSGGYSIWPTPNPVLIPGQTYSLSISTGSTGYPEGAAAWIDYSRNGSFTDSGETVLAPAYTGILGQVYTASVTIPLTAVPGQTLLRCRSNPSQAPYGPCALQYYGEVEDYYVTIASATAINEINRENNISISPNPLTASSILQFNIQLIPNESGAEVVIYDMVGKEILKRKIAGSTMEIEKGGLASGVYFVKLTSGERHWVEKMVVE